MEKKIDLSYRALLLLSSVCLIGGWLVFAPLMVVWFALLLSAYDKMKSEGTAWWEFYSIMLTYMILSISVSKYFHHSLSLITIVQATMLTTPFIIFYHIDINLANRFSKFHIVIYWFAIQYLCLVLFASPSLFFLADAPSLSNLWVNWNIKTGFLGGSLWLFIANLVVFQSFNGQKQKIWLFLASVVLIIVAPILVSFKMDVSALTAQDMLFLYQGYSYTPGYSEFGEVVARTAAWISILIIIFAIVKLKTRKT